MSPAFTNPTTITVVAELLWIMADNPGVNKTDDHNCRRRRTLDHRRYQCAYQNAQNPVIC